MTRFSKIFLYVWFYIGWFGCVYSAQMKKPWMSLLFPLVLLGFVVFKKLNSKKEWFLLSAFFCIGVLFDYLAYQLGLIHFADQQFYFFPVWLISLWVLFVLTLPMMADFFGFKLIWAGLFGALFGPLSYFYGHKLNVLFVKPSAGYIIYAIFWAIYFASTMYLLRKQK